LNPEPHGKNLQALGNNKGMEASIFSERVLELLPPSTRRGIQDLEYKYLKMKHSSFSDRLFISQIEESLKTFSLILEEASCEEFEVSLIAAQRTSIEDCIKFVSGAITNRLQSGRYLYEAHLFTPHNMGSFSKIYSFYESFVDLWEELIVAYSNKRVNRNEEVRLNFLVDISTYSAVNAQLFVPNTCNQNPLNRLVGITINENSFFNIKDTLVLLLHEMGHYVRPYSRNARNRILFTILTNWITDFVFQELTSYLYFEVLLMDQNAKNKSLKIKEEYDKFNAVRTHFEKAVFPAVMPIISMAIKSRFAEFIQRERSDLSSHADEQYSLSLIQFYELLEGFLDDLSDELSATLFVRPKKRVKNKDGILETIVELSERETKVEGKREKVIYFETICKLANKLFEQGEEFEFRESTGNSNPGVAIEAYLRSLSLLGLNEISKSNMDLFGRTLIQCLKTSIERVKGESVLEMFTSSFDEVLAHMFWIRALKISDFESYWQIMEPLMQQSFLNEMDRIRYFGIPNAIITEYFSLLLNGEIQDKQDYKIPPINFPSNHSDTDVTFSAAVKARLIADLRDNFLIPVAKYLKNEDDLFPEEQLFQIKGDIPLSPIGELVTTFRENYKQFWTDSQSGAQLIHELRMISFFEPDSD
jgi:hypothetical protein